jgi:hypothetical protein
MLNTTCSHESKLKGCLGTYLSLSEKDWKSACNGLAMRYPLIRQVLRAPCC